MFGKGSGSATGRGKWQYQTRSESVQPRSGSVCYCCRAYRAERAQDEIGTRFLITPANEGVIQSDILAPEGAPGWCMIRDSFGTLSKRREAQGCTLRANLFGSSPGMSPMPNSKRRWIGQKRAGHFRHGCRSLPSPYQVRQESPCAYPCTMRKLDGENSAPKTQGMNDVALLVKQRESWATPSMPPWKGRTYERVDHRSLKDQGIDRAEPKIGVAPRHEAQGVLEDRSVQSRPQGEAA